MKVYVDTQAVESGLTMGHSSLDYRSSTFCTLAALTIITSQSQNECTQFRVVNLLVARSFKQRVYALIQGIEAM